MHIGILLPGQGLVSGVQAMESHGIAQCNSEIWRIYVVFEGADVILPRLDSRMISEAIVEPTLAILIAKTELDGVTTRIDA